MKAILIYLGFMDQPMPKQQFIQQFKTTYPEEQLTYEQWCVHVRASMLHGRQIVHFG